MTQYNKTYDDSADPKFWDGRIFPEFGRYSIFADLNRVNFIGFKGDFEGAKSFLDEYRKTIE